MSKIWLNIRNKELKKQIKTRPRLCRICGKQTDTGGNLCSSCKTFINRQKG